MNIIITGAGKGLGFELCHTLSCEPGHKVIGISRDISALSEMAENKGSGMIRLGELVPYSFDLLAGHYEDMAAFASMHMEHVDVLVNNAGALINKPFEQLSEADFNLLFGTNIAAPVKMIQALLPVMPAGSHVLNISSMGGYQGSVKFPGLSLYSASKAALAVLSECLAAELSGQGIRVNCLAIGAMQTEMLDEAFPGYQAPLTAAQMAAFVARFAVEGHRYFNGKVLPVAVSTP